jgi:hypothetical protein
MLAWRRLSGAQRGKGGCQVDFNRIGYSLGGLIAGIITLIVRRKARTDALEEAARDTLRAGAPQTDGT